MKPKSKLKPQEPKEAINIAIPNTSQKKMEAIVNLSVAISSLAKALESTNVQVTCAYNVITTPSDGIGINIATPRDEDGAPYPDWADGEQLYGIIKENIKKYKS